MYQSLTKNEKLYVASNLDLKTLTNQFRAQLVIKHADDGIYTGRTGKVSIYEGKEFPRISVEVFFKNLMDQPLVLNYSTHFHAGNQHLLKLLEEFDIDLHSGEEIDFQSLANRSVILTVKNNNQFCNVVRLELHEAPWDIDYDDEFNVEVDISDIKDDDIFGDSLFGEDL